MRVNQVSVKRGASLILEDISFSLYPGKTLAVIGESGAGKFTLISVILRLLKSLKGQSTWSGSPVRSCRPSLVMQEPRSAFNPVLSLRHSSWRQLLVNV
ncbi:MAG: ATP-binding cassette domain-containing protein [Aestuariivita sp.]|nr:ATP-binding cassette domain-containing protein [Aestuariivita sp.]